MNTNVLHGVCLVLVVFTAVILVVGHILDAEDYNDARDTCVLLGMIVFGAALVAEIIFFISWAISRAFV